jgi:AcrR family transcriptional regulator
MRKSGRPKHPVSDEFIVEMATRHFAAGGFAAARLDAIASDVGITKSSLLARCKSKARLYRRVLLDLIDAISERVNALLTGERLGHDDFAFLVDELLLELVTFFNKRPSAARLLLRELLDEGDVYQAGAKAALDGVLQSAADAFARHVDDDIDAQQLVLTIAASLVTPAALPAVASSLVGDVDDNARAAALQRQVRAVARW